MCPNRTFFFLFFQGVKKNVIFRTLVPLDSRSKICVHQNFCNFKLLKAHLTIFLKMHLIVFFLFFSN